MEIDTATTERLIAAAREARLHARAERTGFRVGAALLTQNGEVVTGCNLELNTTLASICAERCAMAKAVSLGHKAFRAIAVVSDADTAVAPCAICRQFLVDFGLDWLVIMANPGGSEVKVMTVGQLVPMAFTGKADLPVNRP